MNNDQRRSYVLYRMESAHKTLDAAKLLADNAQWNSAVNRLYYALFYAVSALLLDHNIEAKTHTATINQFSQHFVKNGLFEKKYGTLLSVLFDSRLKGDYGDIFDFDEERVLSLFDPVREMILRIEGEIKSE
jgi:uncharacterized protein (UPF0332 family)